MERRGRGDGVRLGIDATPLARAKSGIGYHVEFLVRALAKTGGIEEIILFSNREPVFDGDRPARARWVDRRLFPMRAPWLQFLLPSLIREEKPDLVHYVNFNAPVFSSHPFVVTFHDMSVFLHPEYFTWKKRLLTRPLMPVVGRRARAILTVSETVREEIVALLGFERERIFVVPPAPADLYAPVEDSPERSAILRGRNLAGPYILFVGTLEPRKNLAGLLRAFDLLKQEGRIPHRLAVVGGRGWKYSPIFETVDAMRNKSEVLFLDYVPLAELPAIYSAADLLVFPSFYEGFGVPPVEAMRCATPTLVSDLPVTREVLGDASRYVDPASDEAIAEGMLRILSDSGVASDLRRRGLERAALYTWDRAARLALDAYRSVLGCGGSGTTSADRS